MGDLVTVVSEMHPDHLAPGDTDPMPLDGTVQHLLGVCELQRYRWVVSGHTWDDGQEYVHSVRRPTEAEIAQWALQGGTHG